MRESMQDDHSLLLGEPLLLLLRNLLLPLLALLLLYLVLPLQLRKAVVFLLAALLPPRLPPGPLLPARAAGRAVALLPLRLALLADDGLALEARDDLVVVGHGGVPEELLLDLLHGDVAERARDGDAPEDVVLDAAALALAAARLLLELIHDLLQLLALAPALDAQRHDELEEVPVREDVDALAAEEVVDVGDVPAEEVEGVRVVVLDGLRDVDDPDPALVVEQVVLAEVGVDQLALLVEHAHDLHHLQVHLRPRLHAPHLRVLQPRRVLHLPPDEVHHQHVRLHQQPHRTHHHPLHALQVPHLLLGPHAHHLARVAGAVATAEAELALDVAVAVLEDQDRGLVDLDRVLLLGGCVDRVVDVRLLPRREAPVDLGHDLVVEQLQQDAPRALVQHLLDGSAVGLVLGALLLGELLLLALADLIVDFVQVDLRVQLGVGVLVVSLRPPLRLARRLRTALALRRRRRGGRRREVVALRFGGVALRGCS